MGVSDMGSQSGSTDTRGYASEGVVKDVFGANKKKEESNVDSHLARLDMARESLHQAVSALVQSIDGVLTPEFVSDKVAAGIDADAPAQSRIARMLDDQIAGLNGIRRRIEEVTERVEL